MITDKKISILMPVYNGVEFLNDSIKTVIYQTYENWELFTIHTSKKMGRK
tara:strand:- start:13 stop:162 length:150 start_codon:yes stop_codon:yes gene_type:complete